MHREFWRKLPLRWGDVVMMALVALLAGASALLFWQGKTDHLICEISQDGELLYSIQMVEGYQKTIEIPPITTENITNVIQIDGESAYFSHANCPDQVCVHAGVLTRGGQIAVCLPNRVALRLVGEDNAFDAIAQ